VVGSNWLQEQSLSLDHLGGRPDCLTSHPNTVRTTSAGGPR
jgi:hypothetical protein